MRARRRNIEILSLSALDLFASALGAFVIISAILIPYYPNMKEGGKTKERLEAEIKAKQLQAEESLRETEKIVSEKNKRLKEIAASEVAKKNKQAVSQKLKKAQADGIARSNTIARLQKDLDNLKKRNRKKGRQFDPAGDIDFSILGVTSKSKSFVLLVDLSGSMDQWQDLLRNTLYEIVDSFTDDVSFAILGYQNVSVTHYWPPKRRQLALATPQSKRAARAFIDFIVSKVEGGTPTKSALIRAMAYRANSIILVSDGAPSDDEPKNIVKYIRDLNQKRTEINTVAVGDFLKFPILVRFLNQLAKDNKGQFVGVMR
ncbi:MAG: hypothetical protein CMM59_07470 [Rhodospirillaceae bacterium]|nr:hypothetical protein [Rhodospirillaceae bacterium]|tara:strand:- start:1582 stop:2532 length:951 start_codon:yes stop_codon:yes gene_type:complete